MSHRTARSNSIPIPTTTSTTTRNIEDVMLVPFVASPGSLNRSHPSSRSLPPVVLGPTRSLSRPVGSPYEPRIIKSNIPPPISTPRNASTSRTIFNPTSPALASSSTLSFPRPAYLEHSALRHLLQTETPSSLPLSRYKPDTDTETSNSGANLYPYPRRERTPIIDSDDEGSLSPARDLAPPISHALLSCNPVLRLPTRWSDLVCSSHLSVSPDGRELSFVGSSSVGDQDAAAARTNYAIPPACGIYYYEVEILNKGQKGQISIGFSGPEARLSRLPGWQKHSWGYHGEDGSSFAAERSGTPYGPTYTTGDVIGCGIDFSQNKAFYTKNGAPLGPVFDGIGKDCELYPSIGLRHQTEAVRANFGQDPFQYDIEDHVHQRRNQVWAMIQSTAIDGNVLQCIAEGGGSDMVFGAQSSSSSALKNVSITGVTRSGMPPSSAPGITTEDSESVEKKTRSTMDKLVLSYLTHHGYAKTARAFERQCEDGQLHTINETTESSVPCPSSTTCSAAPDDIDLRTKIVRHVVVGDIDAALEATAVNYPGVLEKDQALMLFKLRCRKFIELLLEAAAALKRVKMDTEEEAEDIASPARVRSGRYADGDLEIDGMDIDEDAFRPSHSPANGFLKSTDAGVRAFRKRRPLTASTNAAQSALQDALNYGRQLEMDYKSDSRPEVKTYLNRTFSVVAYEDPLMVGGDVGEIAGQEAREALSTELNQAILEFQGKPTMPALETVYRRAFVCLRQLGLMGVAAAVFADMQKELFDA